MIHQTWQDICVSSRRPHYAQEYPHRYSSGGASTDIGRTATCAVWLPAVPPYFAVVCGRPHPHRDRRRPVLLALQRLSHRACLSGGNPRLGARRPGAAHFALAYHRAAPHSAAVAAGPAQGVPTGVWMVSHTLELCLAGPDVAGQARAHGLRRDDAPLAP